MRRQQSLVQVLPSALLFCFLHGCFNVNAAASGASVPCEPRDLGFDRKEVGWAHVPLSRLKSDTVYTPVPDGDRRGVLRASADGSASMYVAQIKPALQTPMTLAWDWKTDALIKGADSRNKSREDAPLRVVVAFDGDHATLPPQEQKRFKRAKRLSGRELPYALLMYIWTNGEPVGSVISSAHTSQVKMIVVASGSEGLGTWQSVRRHLAEDYQKAYGSWPGPVIGIAVMTDTDNTGAKAVGEYAGLRIACGKD